MPELASGPSVRLRSCRGLRIDPERGFACAKEQASAQPKGQLTNGAGSKAKARNGRQRGGLVLGRSVGAPPSGTFPSNEGILAETGISPQKAQDEVLLLVGSPPLVFPGQALGWMPVKAGYKGEGAGERDPLHQPSPGSFPCT